MYNIQGSECSICGKTMILAPLILCYVFENGVYYAHRWTFMFCVLRCHEMMNLF